MDTARSYTDAYAVAYTYSLCSIERLYLLVGLAVMSDSKIYALVWPYIDVDEKLFPLFWCRILGLMVWLVVQNLLYNSAHAIGFNKRMAVIWVELYSFQYFKNFEMPREQDDQLQVLWSARRRYRSGEVCLCVWGCGKASVKKCESVDIIHQLVLFFLSVWYISWQRWHYFCSLHSSSSDDCTR